MRVDYYTFVYENALSLEPGHDTTNVSLEYQNSSNIVLSLARTKYPDD